MKLLRLKVSTLLLLVLLFIKSSLYSLNISSEYEIEEANLLNISNFGFKSFSDFDKKFLSSFSYNNDDVEKLLPIFESVYELYTERLDEDNWIDDDNPLKTDLNYAINDSFNFMNDFFCLINQKNENSFQPEFKLLQADFVQMVEGSRESKFIAIGDIHGNYSTLSAIINSLIKKGVLNDQLEIQDDRYIFFLGDFTDRGSQNLKITALLMLLMVINKNRDTTYNSYCSDKVFLIRGNHENINYYSTVYSEKEAHSLVKELEDYEVYGDYLIPESINRFLWSFFNLLPQAIYFKVNNSTVQLSHGGWPEFYNPISLIRDKEKFLFEPIDSYDSKSFLWDDIKPMKSDKKKSDRGIGINELSSKYVIEKMVDYDISSIIKGHDHGISKFDLANKINCDVDKVFIKKNTPGSCNIGTTKNPIIVTMAGSVANISYFPGYVFGYFESNGDFSYDFINIL